MRRRRRARCPRHMNGRAASVSFSPRGRRIRSLTERSEVRRSWKRGENAHCPIPAPTRPRSFRAKSRNLLGVSRLRSKRTEVEKNRQAIARYAAVGKRGEDARCPTPAPPAISAPGSFPSFTRHIRRAHRMADRQTSPEFSISDMGEVCEVSHAPAMAGCVTSCPRCARKYHDCREICEAKPRISYSTLAGYAAVSS